MRSPDNAFSPSYFLPLVAASLLASGPLWALGPVADAPEVEPLYLEATATRLQITGSVSLHPLPATEYQTLELVLDAGGRIESLPASLADKIQIQLVKDAYTYAFNPSTGAVEVFNSQQQRLLVLPVNRQGLTSFVRIAQGEPRQLRVNAQDLSLDPASLPQAPALDTSVFTPQDPLFDWQWHLKSSGQLLDGMQPLPGADLNLWPLWQSCPALRGCKGEEVLVAVVDDGLEIQHPDLSTNSLPLDSPTPHRDLSRSAIALGQDPSPTAPDDAHGTAVAGLIAAQDNQLGGLGVAPRATLMGINLLASHINASSLLDAQAMLHQRQAVAVSNNSWGAPDGSGFFNAAEASWQEAIEQGLEEGFNGLGTAYIWAGGNGHWQDGDYYDDYSNLDGQASFHGILAIAAVNADDQRASYSEQGPNLLVSGYGGEDCAENRLVLTTTDLSAPDWGYNKAGEALDLSDRRFTRCFNGTSSAAPTVAGVVALMRQANPQLGWRDLRWLLAHHARHNDPANPNWQTNGAGLTYNREYGFGVADAAASVAAAREHPPLPAYQHIKQAGTATVIQGGQVNPLTLAASTALQQLEFVTLHLNLQGEGSYDSGELAVRLTSPAGTTSLMQPRRNCYDLYEETLVACEAAMDFTLGSVAFLGEQPNGQWILTIDSQQQPNPANLNGWSLTFYGH